MPDPIEQIFTAKAQSTWTFMMQNGQGCYIPAYQRGYRWDRGNVARLFENATTGLEQLIQNPSTIRFLGTIIGVHDTNFVMVHPLMRGDMPQKVMAIIDGQQRLCTIMMLNIAFHDALRRLAASFSTLDGAHYSWLREQIGRHIPLLEQAIFLDMHVGDKNFRYYPRIIRAIDDQWSGREIAGKYTSPIARLIWEYTSYIKKDGNNAFEYTPIELNGGPSPGHESVKDVFRFIQKEIVNVCSGKGENDSLPPIANLLGAETVITSLLRDNKPPTEVAQLLESGPNREVEQFKIAVAMTILSKYVSDRMAFTIVETRTEDEGFEMFESLNTTGEPLTAFETLKPKVIEAETSVKYVTSRSYSYVTQIEKYLNQWKKAEDNQAHTSELLIPFALAETGFKLPKKLNNQRQYLREQYSALNDLNKQRDFLKSLASLAEMFKTAWDAPEGARPIFESFNVNDEETLVCFQALRDIKHQVAISPLLRFLDAAKDALGDERIARIDDFKKAVRTTAAFSMLWRGAKGGTENIDSLYREIMAAAKGGIPPLCKRPATGAGEVSLPNYQKRLRLVLAQSGYAAGADWVAAAARIPIYKHSAKVAKFLLFCATDDAIVDEAEPGLMKKGLRGRMPMFRLDNWNTENYWTVEHIAPGDQSPNWDASFYKDDPDRVHRLGNLILLPQDANSLIGDRAWSYKVMFYKLLAADTGDDREIIQEQMKGAGLNLSLMGQDIIANTDYNQTCKAIIRVTGNWSPELIEKRSKRIAELAWQKLSNWLEFEDPPATS